MKRAAIVLLAPFLLMMQGAASKKCLFVNSYHTGYPWSDGIEKAISKTLEGKCEYQHIEMDTKRNPTPEYAQKKALEIKAHIETWKPDVVITSDDNASKYLGVPYFKDSPIPFVFCGVNWSVSEYGYPFKNTTGMVEILAIEPLLVEVKRIVPGTKAGVCIGPDNESESKNCGRYAKTYKEKGVDVAVNLVKDYASWEKAIAAAQKSDFIIFTNNQGIADWDDAKATKFIDTKNKKLVIGTSDWLTKWATLSMTNMPDEQGEFAAKVAIELMNGKQAKDFPIIPNSRWNIYLNMALADKAGLTIPKDLQQKAIKVTLTN